MDLEIIKQKYLEQHDGKDDYYLPILLDLCKTFPDFNIDLEDLFRAQVSADFISYIKYNINNLEKTYKALNFIKKLQNRPENEYDAVSEDFAHLLYCAIEKKEISLKLLDETIKKEINGILKEEGMI